MLHCLGRSRASSRGIHFLTRPQSKSIRVLVACSTVGTTYIAFSCYKRRKLGFGPGNEATTYKLPVMSSDDSDSPPAAKHWSWGMPSLRRFFSTPAERREVRDRGYYEKLTLEEKRKLYTCGSAYKTLADIPTWEEFQKGKPRPKDLPQSFAVDSKLNQKVSLWKGDITQLEIDAIVNAANSSLLGGGGVDGAIHKAAGPSLRDECATLGGCSTGDAKLSSGHRLPAKYILHTVGPMSGSERQLRSCYTQCLQLVSEKIRSVAFCCIATGVYGYPNVDAAHVALGTIRKWLESDDNADKVDRIIFCVFLRNDYSIYQKLLYQYFPLPPPTETGSGEGGTPPPEDSSNGGGGAEQRDGGGRESDTIPKMERSVTEPARSAALRCTHPDQQQQPPDHEPPAKKQNRDQDKELESKLKEQQDKELESKLKEQQDKELESKLKEQQDKELESELKEQQEETPDQEPRAEATA